MSLININVLPTIGAPFAISIKPSETVLTLKQLITKKIKLNTKKICLLWKESQLNDASTLESNLIQDNSNIRLVPLIEKTGLISNNTLTESTILEALGQLGTGQINEFLSGKCPLNLNMRLGDHVLLVQLQLSRIQQSSSSSKEAAEETKETTANTFNEPTSSKPQQQQQRPQQTRDQITKNLVDTLKSINIKDMQGVYSRTYHSVLENRLDPNESTILYILNDLLIKVNDSNNKFSSSSRKRKPEDDNNKIEEAETLESKLRKSENKKDD